jgi:hypothetical protein
MYYLRRKAPEKLHKDSVSVTRFSLKHAIMAKPRAVFFNISGSRRVRTATCFLRTAAAYQPVPVMAGFRSKESRCHNKAGLVSRQNQFQQYPRFDQYHVTICRYPRWSFIAGLEARQWPRFQHYSRNPLKRINWDEGQSGYAENPDNLIFHWKQATLAVWNWKKMLRTVVLGCIFSYVHIKHRHIIPFMYLKNGGGGI